MPAFQNQQQRNIGFGDGLEKPVLFQKFFVLRVPHKRQVRVKNERKVSLHPYFYVSKRTHLAQSVAAVAKVVPSFLSAIYRWRFYPLIQASVSAFRPVDASRPPPGIPSLG